MASDAALLSGIHRNDWAMVLSSLDHGADINLKNRFGRTALMAAAAKAKPQVVLELFNRGAKLDFKDHTGKSALYLAFQEIRTKSANLLIASGATLTREEKARLSKLFSEPPTAFSATRLEASVRCGEPSFLIAVLEGDQNPATLEQRLNEALGSAGPKLRATIQPVITAWLAKQKTLDILKQLDQGSCKPQ